MSKKFNNRVCVITGAASGIGKSLAHQLAKRGAKLALSDIDSDNLLQLSEQLTQDGHQVFSAPFDVADKNAFFEFATDVKRYFGAAHIVINNAGVGLGSGTLWETELADFDWLMGINFYGVLYGTKAFLPILMEQDFGHIVNISSVFGLVGGPRQHAYNASKFAVRGLTESLRHDLKLAKSNVSCTCVHPGGIKTNIARNTRFSEAALSDQDLKERVAQFDKMAKTTPEQAALKILKAIEKDQQRVLIGLDAKLIDLVQRLIPSSYGRILLPLFKQE